MKTMWTMFVGATAAMVLTTPARGQTASRAPLRTDSSVQPESARAAKEIDDPNSGMRWLLVGDPAHPGGPGRLVVSGNGRTGAPSRPASGKAAPVIHAGDTVQVEEHSAVVEASLQAVALNSAVCGGVLRVRLRIGGRVITARALGPGRAALQPEGERP